MLSSLQTYLPGGLTWISIRPSPPVKFLTLIGSALIIAGLMKFFGINVPISGDGLHIAVAGWLLKTV